MGIKRDVNRELRDSTYDRTREPTRIVGNKRTDAKTSCGGERRWPETAASRPGEAVWTERRERASPKTDEPEPAVAGDRDESRGGEEPRTVQGRGCVQQALRDFTNERDGGWRRAASTACLERGWQESQRTRQRTGSTTSRASPQGPAPLEGRSTRSQHGSSSGRSRVVQGIQECVREPADRGVHGQPVVREHDHGVSAKRGAERPVVAPALVAAGAPLNARLRAGAVLPARGC